MNCNVQCNVITFLHWITCGVCWGGQAVTRAFLPHTMFCSNEDEDDEDEKSNNPQVRKAFLPLTGCFVQMLLCEDAEDDSYAQWLKVTLML